MAALAWLSAVLGGLVALALASLFSILGRDGWSTPGCLAILGSWLAATVLLVRIFGRRP